MTALADLTSVFRSKNAGPFLITIDLMFPEQESYDRVLRSEALKPHTIASRYGVSAQEVDIVPFPRARVIKITLPRTLGAKGSGSAGDRDVYGAQQHGPLLNIEIK